MLKRIHSALITILAVLILTRSADAGASAVMALGYEPKYKSGFSHFTYVNPAAPKGGHINLFAFGTFESLNPYLLKGLSAKGLTGLVFESLTEKSLDEPFSIYGLLASDIRLAADGLSVIYTIDPAARFSNGKPVLAEDVKFSFEILTGEKAHPMFRFYWADISRAVVIDARNIRFEFKRRNPELHLIIGDLPVFAREWIAEEPFDKVVKKPPITSGPYVVDSYEVGKNIVYRKNPDYWAMNKNVRVGMFNFDSITFKYYKDFSVALEGFKSGDFDFYHEYSSKNWARDYTGPQFDNGQILRDELKHQNNEGIQGFFFNLRRPLFQDKRVRKALGLTFDFEWANRNLFYNQYRRAYSYFSNSPLAAPELPDDAELRLLKPFKEKLDPAVFGPKSLPPTTDQQGGLRANLIEAKHLLEDAGWKLRDGVLKNAAGQSFEFEVLLAQKGFDRIIAPWTRNLAKLGIVMNYRLVDTSIFQRRVESFDFDMTVGSYSMSMSPGNELRDMFHSEVANVQGARNYIGITDPVIDKMIEHVIYAHDREELVTAVHALDRVLWHGMYLVPNWYIDTHRAAYWDIFGYPDSPPLYYEAEDWMMKTWWLRK
jgi:microcin C transport system substrate-binding protein